MRGHHAEMRGDHLPHTRDTKGIFLRNFDSSVERVVESSGAQSFEHVSRPINGIGRNVEDCEGGLRRYTWSAAGGSGRRSQ
jgi:hypothetical protein